MDCFKITTAIAIIFLVSTTSSAQQSGVLSYKLLINDNKLNVSRTVNCNLRFKGSKSLEFAEKANEVGNNKTRETPNGIEVDDVVIVKNSRSNFVFKDFQNRKLCLSQRIGNKMYLIDDTLNNFSWKITKEKKKILNYNCTKAVTRFRSRNYVAWYTDDIPIQNGPWKFCGLPGLIIKVSDEDNIFEYVLTKINLKTVIDDKIIKIPNEYLKDKPFTFKNFMMAYEKKETDNKKLSHVVNSDHLGITSSIKITNSVMQEKF